MPSEYDQRKQRAEKIAIQLLPFSIEQDVSWQRQAFQQLNRALYPLEPSVNGGTIFTLTSEWQLGIITFEEYFPYIKAFIDSEELFSHFTYNKLREMLEAADEDQISPTERTRLVKLAIDKMWRSVATISIPVIRVAIFLKYATDLHDETFIDHLERDIFLVSKSLPTYNQFHKTWPPFWANFNDKEIRKINEDILYDEIFGLEEFFRIFDIVSLAKGTAYEPIVQGLRDYVYGIYTSDEVQWDKVSPKMLANSIRSLEETDFEPDFIYAKARALLNQVNRSIENHSGIREATNAFLHILRVLDEFDAAIDFWQTLVATDDLKGDLDFEARYLKKYAIIHDQIDKIESYKQFCLEKTGYTRSGREISPSIRLRRWESDWLDVGLEVAYDHNKTSIVSHPLVLNNLHHYGDEHLLWLIKILIKMPESREHFLPLLLTKLSAVFTKINAKTFDYEFPRNLVSTLEAVIQLKQAGVIE